METDGQTSIQMLGGNPQQPLKATFIFDVTATGGAGIETKFGYLEEASRLSRLLNSWIRFDFNRLKINVLGHLAHIEGGTTAGWKRNDTGEWEKFGDHEEAWRKLRGQLVKEGSYPQHFVYTCNKCGFRKTVLIANFKQEHCSECGAWDWSGVPLEEAS
jgi:hypothetical protein